MRYINTIASTGVSYSFALQQGMYMLLVVAILFTTTCPIEALPVSNIRSFT